MATTSSFSEEDLICPQCTDIYCFPVLLRCGHNVCRACLHKFWEWKGSRECPVCQIVSVLGRPPINLELKLAADEYQQQNTTGGQETCFLHKERLTIFCQNDEEAICLVCQTSKQHKVHACSPVEEAAQQKKTEISFMLEGLRKKLKTLSKTKEQWEETKTYIQTQVKDNEKVIKEEFQKLHRFLRAEESARLKALKQEEQIKTQVMSEKLKSISTQITGLCSTITEIEAALRAKDVSFLQAYKQTKKRVRCNIQEPACIRDILINSAQHLGSLKFGIWKKMANIVQCVPITLDPNTAQSNLELSEELTLVQFKSKRLVPDNPERCTSRVCVLGATGFRYGKHSWTVDVGQSRQWYVGVAQESIKRKSTAFLAPVEGFWVIGRSDGDFCAHTFPLTKLALKHKPERITVELDCDKGKVAFINADDLTTIHTFKEKFKEKIFPFVSPGLYEEEGEISSPLAICPLAIKVDVDQTLA